MPNKNLKKKIHGVIRSENREGLRQAYIDGGGWETIDGWLYLKALRFTDFIDKCQDHLGVLGNIGEIGLYFGKYFLFLNLIKRVNDKVIGIDLFENPEWENRFHENLLAWQSDGEQPIIVRRNSIDLTPNELLDWAGGSYRLFSVDGGHSSEVVLNDLQLVHEVLADGGVIMVDDYFDPKFPGVSEAVNRLYLLSKISPKTEPFLITGNKLFLSTLGYGELYQNAIRKAINEEEVEVWNAEMFGHRVVIIL
ncbi:MAG: class I SAM-dependent methyltransferase [Pseudomonadota bacterium]|nr:class I SAM-dependent methyltransferase [Pseudomonadota bacterium]